MKPTKRPPRRFVGGFVRLLRDITRGGDTYPAGAALKCVSWSGAHLNLKLPKPLPMIDNPSLPRVKQRDVELIEKQHCRECGCTNDNCRGCVERTGEPCEWVEADLCSACAGTSEEE